MYLVIGQQNTIKNKSELREVKASIEKDGFGTGLKGCKAWDVKVKDLSWAIGFSFPDEPIEEWSTTHTRADDVILIAKRVADFFGPGIYYFRGVDEPLESFWDLSLNSILDHFHIFEGLPLSITIGYDNVIEIYMDWIDDFITKHYSDYITPCKSTINADDRLRRIYQGINYLLGLQGDWVFKLSSREKSGNNENIPVSSNLVC